MPLFSKYIVLIIDNTTTKCNHSKYLLQTFFKVIILLVFHQGMLYSLVAAQGNDRLALLHLGYKHDQGIDGYPLDYGVSYGYYINIAQRTVKDRHDFDVEQVSVMDLKIMAFSK